MVGPARLLAPASVLDRGLLPLFHRRSPYAFYDTDLVGSGEGIVIGSVDAHALIVAALRGGARPEVVGQVLDQLGEQPLRLGRGSDLSRFAFLPKEQTVVEPARIAGGGVLDHRAVGGRKIARRVLYALTIAKCLEAHTPTTAGTGSIPPRPSTPPAAPARLSSPPPARPTAPVAPAPPAAASPRPAEPPRLPGSPEPGPPPPPSLGPELSQRWRRSPRSPTPSRT